MPEWVAIAGLILGVGSPLASLVIIFRWLIRRQADGHWMLTSEHDKQMAEKERIHREQLEDKDRQISGAQLVISEVRATSETKNKIISDQAVALRQSTDSGRYIDMIVSRAFQGAGQTPTMGDNGSEEAATA